MGYGMSVGMIFLAENDLNVIQGVSIYVYIISVCPKTRHTTHPVHGDHGQAVFLATNHQTVQQ